MDSRQSKRRSQHSQPGRRAPDRDCSGCSRSTSRACTELGRRHPKHRAAGARHAALATRARRLPPLRRVEHHRDRRRPRATRARRAPVDPADRRVRRIVMTDDGNRTLDHMRECLFHDAPLVGTLTTTKIARNCARCSRRPSAIAPPAAGSTCSVLAAESVSVTFRPWPQTARRPTCC